MCRAVNVAQLRVIDMDKLHKYSTERLSIAHLVVLFMHGPLKNVLPPSSQRRSAHAIQSTKL